MCVHVCVCVCVRACVCVCVCQMCTNTGAARCEYERIVITSTNPAGFAQPHSPPWVAVTDTALQSASIAAFRAVSNLHKTGKKKECTPSLPCIYSIYSGFVSIAMKENWKMLGTSSCTVRTYSACQNIHS